MMYYPYLVFNTDLKWCFINTQFPIYFYKLKYDFTVYEQFFYDDLMLTSYRVRFTLIRFPQPLPKNSHIKCVDVIVEKSTWQNMSNSGQKRKLWHILKQLNFLGGNSQNFLSKFLIFFVTLGLKILRLKWLKVVFEADINKKWC